MKYVALSLLIGFIAISIFSFGFMNHGESHSTGDCIASVVDKVTCPQIGLATALHHISAYQAFSKALTPLSASAYLLLMLVLIGASLIFSKYLFKKNYLGLYLQYVRYRKKEQKLNLRRSSKITAWLSLLENSPSTS